MQATLNLAGMTPFAAMPLAVSLDNTLYGGALGGLATSGEFGATTSVTTKSGDGVFLKPVIARKNLVLPGEAERTFNPGEEDLALAGFLASAKNAVGGEPVVAVIGLNGQATGVKAASEFDPITYPMETAGKERGGGSGTRNLVEEFFKGASPMPIAMSIGLNFTSAIEVQATNGMDLKVARFIVVRTMLFERCPYLKGLESRKMNDLIVKALEKWDSLLSEEKSSEIGLPLEAYGQQRNNIIPLYGWFMKEFKNRGFVYEPVVPSLERIQEILEEAISVFGLGHQAFYQVLENELKNTDFYDERIDGANTAGILVRIGFDKTDALRDFIVEKIFKPVVEREGVWRGRVDLDPAGTALLDKMEKTGLFKNAPQRIGAYKPLAIRIILEFAKAIFPLLSFEKNDPYNFSNLDYVFSIPVVVNNVKGSDEGG